MSKGKSATARGKVDVPQADSLDSIRAAISALTQVGNRTEDVSKATGVSMRHVMYRLHAAHLLGLISGSRELTGSGRALLSSPQGSKGERGLWADCIESAAVVKRLCPHLLTAKTLDLDHLTKAICRASGLSHSTASRRARVLRAWRRQVRAD